MSVFSEAKKWQATVKTSWTNYMAYKLNFLLLVIGPVLVFFFIRYSLWSAIYHLEGIQTLQGYDFETMLAYQVWVMMIGFLALGYNGMNLAQDIRMGRISAYLIYPFGFWQFHASHFLAFQLIQLGVSAFTLLCVGAMGWVEWLGWQALLNGFMFSMVIGLFWFQLSFLIGTISFWLEETWVLRVMMITISQFFSGAILPLEMFPDWLVKSLAYTPFPYMTYVPVRLFMGSYSGSLWVAYGAILAWTTVVSLCSVLVWKKGLKLYTAAGM